MARHLLLPPCQVKLQATYLCHTVILPDWTLKEFIETQSKKNLWNPARDSWGPYYQDTVISALSEKLPKWHFLAPACNLMCFEPNDFIWRAMKVPLFEFIQKMSQAPFSYVQVLIWEDKLD